MLPLGHMGLTVVVVKLAEKFFSPWVDYRLLLVASLLPDLIDKPVRYFLGAQPLFSGKYYGHSWLFLFTIFIMALLQWYYWDRRTLFTLFMGICSHDFLDAVSHHTDWEERALFDFRILLLFEVIGGCILLYLFRPFVFLNKMGDFIKDGKL